MPFACCAPPGSHLRSAAGRQITTLPLRGPDSGENSLLAFSPPLTRGHFMARFPTRPARLTGLLLALAACTPVPAAPASGAAASTAAKPRVEGDSSSEDLGAVRDR